MQECEICLANANTKASYLAEAEAGDGACCVISTPESTICLARYQSSWRLFMSAAAVSALAVDTALLAKCHAVSSQEVSARYGSHPMLKLMNRTSHPDGARAWSCSPLTLTQTVTHPRLQPIKRRINMGPLNFFTPRHPLSDISESKRFEGRSACRAGRSTWSKQECPDQSDDRQTTLGADCVLRQQRSRREYFPNRRELNPFQINNLRVLISNLRCLITVTCD